MTDIYTFSNGTLPLLVSIPHDGRALMPGQQFDMTEAGKAIPDTDWHVQKLYEFAHDFGASVIGANYSRYVVDLNRPASDAALYENQLSTGLCPVRTFDGENIYRDGFEVTPRDRQHRIQTYWNPYHAKIRNTLGDLHSQFGYALLWDAHSIRSEVPTLFDGSLPDLNIGTNDGASCAADISDDVTAVAESTDYSVVLNDRFKGGYITRRYGRPGDGIHAVQLELAQKTYMEEPGGDYVAGRADRLCTALRGMLTAYVDAAKNLD